MPAVGLTRGTETRKQYVRFFGYMSCVWLGGGLSLESNQQPGARGSSSTTACRVPYEPVQALPGNLPKDENLL